MYTNPVLFPQISNRESWLQTVQIYDDDTGDLITLVDVNGNSLYEIDLIINHPGGHGCGGMWPYSSYDSWSSNQLIFQSLGQGMPAIGTNPALSIVDLGTITIFLSRSTIQTLRHHETYGVFLVLYDVANDDARQLLIGRLPVFYGGGPSGNSIARGTIP